MRVKCTAASTIIIVTDTTLIAVVIAAGRCSVQRILPASRSPRRGLPPLCTCTGRIDASYNLDAAFRAAAGAFPDDTAHCRWAELAARSSGVQHSWLLLTVQPASRNLSDSTRSCLSTVFCRRQSQTKTRRGARASSVLARRECSRLPGGAASRGSHQNSPPGGKPSMVVKYLDKRATLGPRRGGASSTWSTRPRYSRLWVPSCQAPLYLLPDTVHLALVRSV